MRVRNMFVALGLLAGLALVTSGCKKEKKEGEVNISEVVGIYSGEFKPTLKDVKVTPEIAKDAVLADLKKEYMGFANETAEIVLEQNPNDGRSVVLKEADGFGLNFREEKSVGSGILFNLEQLDKKAAVMEDVNMTVSFKGGVNRFSLMENGKETAKYAACYDKAKRAFNFAFESEVKMEIENKGDKYTISAVVEFSFEGVKK